MNIEYFINLFGRCWKCGKLVILDKSPLTGKKYCPKCGAEN